MNVYLLIILLFGLQLLYFFIGKRSFRNSNSYIDYFLAGKSIRFWPLAMTFFATQAGGGLILGSADEAYRFGWEALLFPMGSALGLILLGCGVGNRLAKFKVPTIAAILEEVYSAPMLRRLASIFSVLSLFMILSAQMIASAKFFTSLGMDNAPIFVAFWSFVIIYTVQGGLRAVIATDVIQGLLFFLVFLVWGGFVFFGEGQATLMQLPQWEGAGCDATKISGWLLMPLLFVLVAQDMGQRCIAGASPKIVSKAAVFAGIGILVVCAIPVFFGVLARDMGFEIDPKASVLMAALAKTANPWIGAIIGCVVLTAITTTAISLVNAIGSNLSSDFKLSFLRKKEHIPIVQGITCSISLAAILFAFSFDSIVDLLMQSYELSASCLFVPIFIALFRRRGPFAAAWLSLLFGLFGFCALRFFPIPFPRELASLFLSLMGYLCGEVWYRSFAPRSLRHPKETDFF